MRSIYFLAFFLAILIVHTGGIYFGNGLIEGITKPLPVILLILYFISETRAFSSGLKKWMLGALVFSLAGDILLMFVPDHANYFMAGLIAFLLAHLCYIFFFHSIRIFEKIPGKLFMLLIVLVYDAALISILNPFLGALKLPVRIYSVVICFMLMLAMHMLYLRKGKGGGQMFAGAVLFILSDSILAINKFYAAFDGAGILIMLTYGVAQLLLTRGAIAYIRWLKDETAPE